MAEGHPSLGLINKLTYKLGPTELPAEDDNKAAEAIAIARNPVRLSLIRERF
jgi:hypothetical protein